MTNWWTNDSWNLSYVPDIYQPVYGGHSVQVALQNTLAKWMPTYIYEFNRQLGGEILSVPKYYKRMPEQRTLPRNVEAAVIVATTGTTQPPERLGTGFYTTYWRSEVTLWLYGTKDFLETQALTYAYTAAVRAAIMQHRSLGGFASDTRWTGEDYRYGEHSSTRYIGMGTVDLEVVLMGALNDLGGPPLADFAPDPSNATPSLGPTPMQPEVEKVDVTIKPESV